MDKEEIMERISRLDELIDTEGTEWFARFDCESGTYKQLEDLKEEKKRLLAELKKDEHLREDVEIEELEPC